MKFFMEKNKDAGHRVTIKIPKKTVKDSFLKELIKISKTTKINGFRKGKIPIKVIQEKYGDSIYYDIINELMQKFFYEFIQKEKIKIIGSPKYYIHKNEKEDKKIDFFEYSVIYEIYPEFQMTDIENIKVNKINVNITNEDIQNNIEKDKNIKYFWNPSNQSIKSNDRVTINYCIYEKNKKIKKFNRENVKITVSQNTFIPQLHYKIINHFINDIIFFKIKFNQFHPEKELQNKDITFKIKIIKIERKQEKELEENDIKNINKKKLNELDYESIKHNVYSQIDKITEKNLEDQIIQKIIKKNIFAIPPLLFQEQIKILYKKQKKQYSEKNSNILEKKYHFNLDFKVKKILYMQIILKRIISDNKLLSNENNIKEMIRRMSLNYKKPIEIINLYNTNKNFKNTIKNIELEKQAMFFLKKRIKITKEYWNFDRFVNYNWNNHEELII